MLALVLVKVLLPKWTGAVTLASIHIQVLAKCSLEPGKSLYLVKTGDQVVLLATSAGSIHFLTNVNPEEFQNAVGFGSDAPTSSSSFRRCMHIFAGRNQDKAL
jgi:flagellar biogenesis protein FliO